MNNQQKLDIFSNNPIALILQILAVLEVLGGLILTFMIAYDFIEGLGLFLAFLISGFFIYSIGYVIDLLVQIKDNTAKGTSTNNKKQISNELPEL